MSLRYLILGMLEEAPLHGYELKHKIETTFGDVWPVSFGQLYPALHRMAVERLIIRSIEPGKKTLDKTVYRITEKGAAVFREWLTDIPKEPRFRFRDEFTVLFYFLRKLPKVKIVDVLTRQRRYIESRAGSYDLHLESRAEDDFYVRSIIKKGSALLHAELSWLDEVLGELNSTQP